MLRHLLILGQLNYIRQNTPWNIAHMITEIRSGGVSLDGSRSSRNWIVSHAGRNWDRVLLR